MFRDSCPVTSDVIFLEAEEMLLWKHQLCTVRFCSFRDKNHPYFIENKMGWVRWSDVEGPGVGQTWDLKPVSLWPRSPCAFHSTIQKPMEEQMPSADFRNTEWLGVLWYWKDLQECEGKGATYVSTLSYLGHDTIHNVAFSIVFKLVCVHYMMKYKNTCEGVFIQGRLTVVHFWRLLVSWLTVAKWSFEGLEKWNRQGNTFLGFEHALQ